ncbi:MAG: histidinol-phosphate transaminase [Spartobacteria bacterium]|nr:histidinol-phosphate transaminase [Spartobacteria bacterium]
MSTIPNMWIKNLAFYEPGRPIDELARELGLSSADEIIKLASNENALGPSPKAVDAMQRAASNMHIYPDGGSFYLRLALAQKYHVDMDQIIVGNGSNEIIEFLAHVYLQPGSNLVMADKAFIVYKLIAPAYQAEAITVPMVDLTHDLDAMLAAITPQTRMVFIANPNNPTGTMLSQDALDAFMDQVPASVAVVFDEAYIELLPPDRQPDTMAYVKSRPNVYVLRTFSKAYGLAGLRVGYGISTAENIQLLNRVRQPFNVNAMAQEAAMAALEDDEHVEIIRKLVIDGLAFLQNAFEEMGLEYVPSVANFILVKVGRGRKVFDALQQRLIIVRPMDGYGLPEYVRITVGTADQNRRLVLVMKQLIEEGIIEK